MENLDFVQALHKQLEFHETQANALRTLIAGYSQAIPSSFVHSDDKPQVNKSAYIDSPKSSFPKIGKKNQQAIWIFKNVLRKASRMPDIQAAYEEVSGNTDDITMSVRLLKKSSISPTIKKVYGNDNNKTYWGLQEWFSAGDFLQDFHPFN